MNDKERQTIKRHIATLKDQIASLLRETIGISQEVESQLERSDLGIDVPLSDGGAFKLKSVADKATYMVYQAGQLKALVKVYKMGANNETDDRSNKEAAGGGVGEKLVQGQDGAQDSQD